MDEELELDRFQDLKPRNLMERIERQREDKVRVFSPSLSFFFLFCSREISSGASEKEEKKACCGRIFIGLIELCGAHIRSGGRTGGEAPWCRGTHVPAEKQPVLCHPVRLGHVYFTAKCRKSQVVK